MKTLVLVAALAGFAAPVSADDIFGTWQTIADDNGNSGHIDVSACGAKICGVLVNSFDKDGKAFKSVNQGRKLIWDMENKGGGNYGGVEPVFALRDDLDRAFPAGVGFLASGPARLTPS